MITATSLRAESTSREPEVEPDPPARFTTGEADRWIGLTLEHTAQLLVLDTLLRFVVGMHDHLVLSRVLPGVGLGLLVGNLGSAWLSRRHRQERGAPAPVMAVGLDMASIFLICFLVVLPLRAATQNSFVAWQVGAMATVIAGMVQCAAIFAPLRVRDEIANSAVLSPVGALAFLFLSLPAVFGIFTVPTLLLAILAVVALWAVARARLEHGLPAGLLVLIVCAWAAWLVGIGGSPTQAASLGVRIPLVALQEVFGALQHASAASVAMAVASGVFGMATTARILRTHREHDGRTTDVDGHVLLGAATVLGGFTGSIVPMTFVDLPAEEQTPSRTRFLVPAIVVVVALCFTGALAAIVRLLPTEAALAVVVWLGMASAARGMRLYDLDADDGAADEPAAFITRPKRAAVAEDAKPRSTRLGEVDDASNRQAG